MRILMTWVCVFFLIANFSTPSHAGGKSDSLNQGPAYLFTHPTGWMWKHVELCRTLRGISKYEKTLKKLSWNDWKQLKSGNRDFTRSDKCSKYGKLWGEYFEQSLQLINELALRGIHPKSNHIKFGAQLEGNQFAVQGVKLTGVADGSPVDQAGLQVGDVILQLNEWKIYRKRDAHLLAYILIDEAYVEVYFSRNGIPSTVLISVDELSALDI